MIQLIIFDLDVVLIDSKNIHFEAPNSALAALTPGFRITKEEHLAIYDGLPTREKLKLLTKKKGLPTFKHADIAELKPSELKAHLKQQKGIYLESSRLYCNWELVQIKVD